MKQYIRASFDNEIPDWLRDDKRALEALNRAGVDLKNATFDRTRKGKIGDNYTIYKVKTDGDRWFVWIPGVYNDDQYVPYQEYDWRYHGNRTKYKAVKYWAKKDLDFLDTVYVNINDSSKAARDHYVDPRYIYEKGKAHGEYAGQYFTPSDRYNGIQEPGEWSSKGKVEYYSRYGSMRRDKSGYVIPNPAKRLEEFHNTPEGQSRQAAKARKKIESVYNQLVALKDDIFNRLSVSEIDTFGDYYSALDYFRSAVNDYKRALQYVELSWGLDSALEYIDNAQSGIDRVQKML